MAITLDGTLGVTTPSYGGASAAEYLVPVTAFKNRIINGNGIVAQRGSQFITASGSGGAGGTIFGTDRWRTSASISAAGGGIFATLTGSNTTATVNGTSASAMTFTSSSGGTPRNITITNISQRIEAKNCQDLVGQSVTLSYWMLQNTGATLSFSCNLSYASALDDFTSIVSINSNSQSVPSGVWTYLTSTFTSLPAGVANGLQVNLVNTNITIDTLSKYLQFSNVQLEKGTTATSFDYRPYGSELALCQRYLPAILLGDSGNRFLGVAASTTTSSYIIPFYVTPRAAPTGVTTTAVSNFSLSNSSGGVPGSVTAIAFGVSGLFNATLTATTTAGSPTLAAGNVTTFFGGAGSQILFTGCEL
jgi:hypothetical protein